MVESSNIVFIIIAVIGGSFAMIAMGGGLQISDSAIPPTNAFDRINFDGVWYNATTFDDILTITSQGDGVGATIDTTTCNVGDFISAVNNSTGLVTCSSAGGATIDTTTCNAGDFISAVNNSTGLVTCSTQATSLEMKSGIASSVTSTTWVTITFGTAFTNTPVCVITPIGITAPQDHKSQHVKAITTTAFDIWQKERNALALDVAWICIEASDP